MISIFFRFPAVLILFWLSGPAALSQTAPEPQDNFTLSAHPTSPGSYALTAPGKTGRVYFFQMSADQENWAYASTVQLGSTGTPQEYSFTPIAGQKYFFRLKYTVETIYTAGAAGDIDGDGLSNAAELTASTDPFNPDSDYDGMPDGWEVLYGLNPRSDADANTDSDSDTLANVLEYQLGTKPKGPGTTSRDSDDDGLDDNVEFNTGGDPVHFTMPGFTLVSATRQAILTENLERPYGGAVTHTASSTANGRGTLAGTYPSRTFTDNNPSLTAPYNLASMNSTAGSAWGSVIPEPLLPVEMHDINFPLFASRKEKMHGDGDGNAASNLDFLPGNGQELFQECRTISRQGTILERTVRVQATRAMKVAWSIPYTRTTISKTFRDGEWSAPSVSTGSFNFGVGDTFSNAVTMDVLSTATTGGAVALRPGRKRANSSSTTWNTTLFTTAEAVEWLTVDKIPSASTNVNTDTDRDGVLNTLEDRMGTNKAVRNSDGAGYADGDQLNQKLLPPVVRFITTTRDSEYEFSPFDPRCPYHPANRIEMETDSPPESDVDDNLAARIGLEDSLHTRLDLGSPFPQNPPAGAGIPQLNEDGTSADLASDPTATMGYTNKPDSNNASNSTEAAEGKQRRIWLGIPEALSYDTTYNLMVTRTVTQQNGNGNPTNSAPTATLITRTIPAGSTTTSAAVELLAKRSPGGSAEHVTATEKLTLPGIEPDAGMAGVLGDTISSINPTSGVKHFVTPKKLTKATDPTALKAGYVTLKATGITVEQITPNGPNQTMEWEVSPFAAGQLDPAKPLECKISRDAPERFEVKIKKKAGGAPVFQMNVWVVWASVTSELIASEFVPTRTIAGSGVAWTSPPTPLPGWRFKFTILPVAICEPENLERPNLAGNSSDKGVPGKKKPYKISIDPKVMGDSAPLKWDVSRQIQVTIHNPLTINKRKYRQVDWPPAFYEKVTDEEPRAILFPTDVNDAPISSHVEGNDDSSSTDENANPYAAFTSAAGALDHAIGQITSLDAPSFFLVNEWGEGVARFSVEANFREFGRLELWDGNVIRVSFGSGYPNSKNGITI